MITNNILHDNEQYVIYNPLICVPLRGPASLDVQDNDAHLERVFNSNPDVVPPPRPLQLCQAQYSLVKV